MDTDYFKADGLSVLVELSTDELAGTSGVSGVVSVIEAVVSISTTGAVAEVNASDVPSGPIFGTAGAPYMLSIGSVLVASHTIKIIHPTIGINHNNCHQPLRPVS